MKIAWSAIPSTRSRKRSSLRRQRAGLAFGALRRCPVIDGGGDPDAQDHDGGGGEQEGERRLTYAEMSGLPGHGIVGMNEAPTIAA